MNCNRLKSSFRVRQPWLELINEPSGEFFRVFDLRQVCVVSFELVHTIKTVSVACIHLLFNIADTIIERVAPSGRFGPSPSHRLATHKELLSASATGQSSHCIHPQRPYPQPVEFYVCCGYSEPVEPPHKPVYIIRTSGDRPGLQFSVFGSQLAGRSPDAQ